MIYDDVVAETLIEPLPDDDRADEAPDVHDATDCPVCQKWLAHVREAEGS